MPELRRGPECVRHRRSEQRLRSSWEVEFRNGARHGRRRTASTAEPEHQFAQDDGDFETFRGTWKARAAGRSAVPFRADFDFGIPSLRSSSTRSPSAA